MTPTSAILVRVGIDASYGAWNAPADPRSGKFVYVPIPEAGEPRPGQALCYSALLPDLEAFRSACMLNDDPGLELPSRLHDVPMHLDPDFDHLTYGDNGSRRGSQIARLGRGDLLAFYAGLRSVVEGALIYGLVGVLTVDEIVPVGDVPIERLGENAHTRRLHPDPTEFVVRGTPECSGRFTRYVPIGEWRDGAYRVRRDLLDEWGGLSVRDGFIQRSARPPRFLHPARFFDWLDQQDIALVARNN